MDNTNIPGPSGMKKPRLSKYVSNRPLTEQELQIEANKIEAECSDDVPENSSESEDDFSDDDSIADKTYLSETSVNSSEDTESDQSESEDEQQLDLTDVPNICHNKSTNPTMTQKKFTKYISDEHYGWGEVEEDVTEFDFTGMPSINVNLPANAKPIDYFNVLFDNDIINTIVCETNR
uniref:Uncharacterized protein LOC114326807 n=1 Tax=Diabrotica virgifera virgifera TaxID=50390 RepID=A0A6P7F6E1_DIAVI